MFLNHITGISYLTAGTTAPASRNFSDWVTGPRADTGSISGCGLVAQYIEGMRFRTNSFCRIQAANLNAVHEKALLLDETLCDLDQIDEVSDTYPTLKSVMDAFVNLAYVKNITQVGLVQPTVAAVKYFTYQYGGMILETKITSTTYNASGFDISSAGTLLTEDFTKGFITVGYNNTYLYLQNNLGINSGSLGLMRMTWSVFPQLAVKGAVFHLTNALVNT